MIYKIRQKRFLMTVYILRQANSDYFKVGYTEGHNVEGRRQDCQTGNPQKLEVYHVIKNGSAMLEARLHDLLSIYKTDGGNEWFQLSEDELLKILAASEQEELLEEKLLLKSLIKNILHSRNMTITDLQVRTGLGWPTVHKVVKEKYLCSRTTFKTLRRVAAVLDVNISDLYEREEK